MKAENYGEESPPYLFLLSLWFLLCAAFTPPLQAFCQPSELCVHFDPLVTATHAFWPYSFKVTTKPDILLLVQAVTMRFFFSRDT